MCFVATPLYYLDYIITSVLFQYSFIIIIFNRIFKPKDALSINLKQQEKQKYIILEKVL